MSAIHFEGAAEEVVKGKIGTSENSEALTRDLAGLRILVAEDNEINQILALLLLEKQNHIVMTVGNGQEGLDAIYAEDYDCVLMEMEIPILDGIKITRLIRAKEADGGEHLTIIAMTAKSMRGDEEDCLQAGMDGYISKSVDLQSLDEELDRLVARPETEKEEQLFVESVPESTSDESGLEPESEAEADVASEAEGEQAVAHQLEADEDAIGDDSLRHFPKSIQMTAYCLRTRSRNPALILCSLIIQKHPPKLDWRKWQTMFCPLSLLPRTSWKRSRWPALKCPQRVNQRIRRMKQCL